MDYENLKSRSDMIADWKRKVFEELTGLAMSIIEAQKIENDFFPDSEEDLIHLFNYGVPPFNAARSLVKRMEA